MGTEHIHILWTEVIYEGWISAQDMKLIMHVTVRNFIYDASFVFINILKYISMTFYVIKQYSWGKSSQNWALFFISSCVLLEIFK